LGYPAVFFWSFIASSLFLSLCSFVPLPQCLSICLLVCLPVYLPAHPQLSLNIIKSKSRLGLRFLVCTKILEPLNLYIRLLANIYFYLKDCQKCGSLIIYENTFPIYWGHSSILEADLLCIHRLLQDNKGTYNCLLNQLNIDSFNYLG